MFKKLYVIKLYILFILTILSLLACAGLGVIVYLPAGRIRAAFDSILATFQMTTESTLILTGLVIGLGLIMALALGAALGWERWQQSRTTTTFNHLKNREYEIQILRAGVIFERAAPGHQVYRHDVATNLTTPLHLTPGAVNGYPIRPTDSELQRWYVHAMLYGKVGRAEDVLTAAPDPAPLIAEGALEYILRAERRLISGASGSGKSSLAKHIIWQEWQRGTPTIPIDPHHEGEAMLGFPVIGAGRRYDLIEQAIETLYLAMDVRYKQAAAGFQFSTFDSWHIIIDELTAILANTSKATLEMLTLLIIESRKVRVRLTVLGHSYNVADLGLSGPIRSSLSVWNCTGGNGEPVGPIERMKAEGSRLRPDGQFTHPGPFTGALDARALIIDLPAPDIIRARGMAAEGESATAIARVIFKTGKATGPQVNQVKKWLEDT